MKHEFKNVIKDIRVKNNLTQKELAKQLNVTSQAVSKWERGLNYPDIEIIKQISKKYNIDMNLLINGKSNKKIKYLLLLLIPVLFIVCLLFDNTYNFSELSSLNKDFKVDGVIAYSNKKTSINISKITYIGKDNEEFILLDAILYEQNGDQIKKINNCSNNECNLSNLNKSLEDISFNIKDFKRTCKTFTHNNIYIELIGKTKDKLNIKYTIPIEMKEEC